MRISCELEEPFEICGRAKRYFMSEDLLRRAREPGASLIRSVYLPTGETVGVDLLSVLFLVLVCFVCSFLFWEWEIDIHGRMDPSGSTIFHNIEQRRELTNSILTFELVVIVHGRYCIVDPTGQYRFNI